MADSIKEIGSFESEKAIVEAASMGRPANVMRDVQSFISLTQVSDPVTLGFKLFFRYDTEYGLLANEKYDTSALAYLKRINDTIRYDLLKRFIAHLQFLNMEMSFLFQTIDGLDTIRTKKPWERFNDDAKVTVGTLETVDFKVQALMSMYKQIYFDDIRGVYILPVNLRRFDCSIFVYSSATYQVTESTTGIDNFAYFSVPNAKRQYGNDSSSEVGKDNYYVKAPDMYNHIVYYLSECEFLPHDSQDGGFFKPSNTGATETATNTIAFSFRWCRDAWQMYGLTGANQISATVILAAAIADDKNSSESLITKLGNFKSSLFGDSFMGKLGESLFDKAAAPLTSRASDIIDKYGSLEKLKQQGLNAVKDLATNTVDALARKIGGKLEGMLLGNVYGVSPSNIIGALTGDNLAGGLTQLASKATGSSASTKSESKLTTDTNVYNKM